MAILQLALVGGSSMLSCDPSSGRRAKKSEPFCAQALTNIPLYLGPRGEGLEVLCRKRKVNHEGAIAGALVFLEQTAHWESLGWRIVAFPKICHREGRLECSEHALKTVPFFALADSPNFLRRYKSGKRDGVESIYHVIPEHHDHFRQIASLVGAPCAPQLIYRALDRFAVAVELEEGLGLFTSTRSQLAAYRPLTEEVLVFGTETFATPQQRQTKLG
jgi:hypothetical protein